MITNKNINIQNTEEDFYPHAPWLVETLKREAELLEFCQPVTQPMTEEVKRQCIETADMAMAIARMQAEREKFGFRPFPLTDYLKQLADSAGASLSIALSRFGLQELSRLGKDTTRSFSLLARELGQSLEETLMQVQIEFAGLNGGGLIPATSKRRALGTSTDNLIEQTKQWLEKVEAEYNAKQGKEITHLAEEVRAAYTNAD